MQNNKLKETFLANDRLVGIDRLTNFITIFITNICLRLSITSMQVMFFWFIIRLLTCLIIVKGSYFEVLLGVFIFQFCSILDSVDGLLLKYESKESMLGLYLDQLIHNITNPLFILSLAIATNTLLVGICIVIVYISNRLVVFNPLIYNFKKKQDKKAIKKIIEPTLNKLSYSRLKINERNFISNICGWFRVERMFGIIFFAALFNMLKPVLYFYFGLFIADLIRRLINQIKMLIKVDNFINN